MLALLALPLLVAACQSDPEVGSTLYPTSAENYDAKAYINTNTPTGGIFSLRVFKTPTGSVVPNDTATFYVQLNRPVAQDVTVTLKEASDKATKANGADLLQTGSINIINPTVVIPQGQTRSTLPVKVALVKGASLDKLVAAGKNGATAIVIESAQGVAVGSNYNKVQINARLQSTNIVAGGKVDDLTEIASYTYGLYDSYNRELAQLKDGDMSNYYSIYLRYNPKLVFTFDGSTTVAGISIYPTTYESYQYYFVTQARVETSNDYRTWTDQGTISLPSPIEDIVPLHIRFYSPVTPMYMRVVPTKTFSGSYMAIGEVKLYK